MVVMVMGRALAATTTTATSALRLRCAPRPLTTTRPDAAAAAPTARCHHHPCYTPLLRRYVCVQDEECFFIVYELLDDELFNVVHATPGRRVPEAVARTYFWQAALGLHYCHSRGIVHRDISLENLMLLKAWPLAPHPASPPPAPPAAPPAAASASGDAASTAAGGGSAAAPAAGAAVLFPAGTVKIIDFGLAQVLPGSALSDLLPDDDKGGEWWSSW